MAWGGGNGVDSWVKRLRENDPSFTSLHILSFRRVTPSELGQVFDALKTNTTLQELYASGHAFDEAAAKILASTLEQNTTLERLNIGSDQLGSNEGVVKVLAEGLAKNKGLVRLDLENKGLGGYHATSLKSLAEALERNDTLKELNLARNKLTDQDIEVLCQALSRSSHKSLAKLDLSLNAFEEAGIRCVATFLAGQDQKDQGGLTEIDLSDNEITEEGGRAVGQALETNKALQRLRMSSCMEPLPPVAEGVEDKILWDDDMESLNTPLTPEQEQQIRSDGDGVLETISAALKTNDTLQELWMDYCNISSVGATFLAEALRHNQSLITVRMRNNRIGNRGGRALGAALSTTSPNGPNNSTLKNLELGSNKIGVLGWDGLVGANSLESLGLYENGIHVLHEALENHLVTTTDASSTTTLSSTSVPNGTSAAPQVLEKLIHLDVGCNGISREDYTQLGICLIKGLLPALIRLEIAGNGDRSQQPGNPDGGDDGSNPGPEDPEDEQSAWERVTARIAEARPNLDIQWKGAGAMQQA